MQIARVGQPEGSRVHSGGMRPSTGGPEANHGSGAITGVLGAFIQAPHQLKVELAITLPAAYDIASISVAGPSGEVTASASSAKRPRAGLATSGSSD